MKLGFALRKIIFAACALYVTQGQTIPKNEITLNLEAIDAALQDPDFLILPPDPVYAPVQRGHIISRFTAGAGLIKRGLHAKGRYETWHYDKSSGFTLTTSDKQIITIQVMGDTILIKSSRSSTTTASIRDLQQYRSSESFPTSVAMIENDTVTAADCLAAGTTEDIKKCVSRNTFVSVKLGISLASGIRDLSIRIEDQAGVQLLSSKTLGVDNAKTVMSLLDGLSHSFASVAKSLKKAKKPMPPVPQASLNEAVIR